MYIDVVLTLIVHSLWLQMTSTLRDGRPLRAILTSSVECVEVEPQCLSLSLMRDFSRLSPKSTKVMNNNLEKTHLLDYCVFMLSYLFTQVKILPKQHHRGTLHNRGMSRTVTVGCVVLSIQLNR